jgi:hypothetical protein
MKLQRLNGYGLSVVAVVALPISLWSQTTPQKPAADSNNSGGTVLTSPATTGSVPGAEVSAAIDAWRIEMAYVKANRPHRVNGFLVGSGGGTMGTIVLKKGLSSIDGGAFTCTLLKPVVAGEEWSAFVMGSQSRSMSNVEMGQFAYPILAMITVSGGKVFTVVPATLRAKIDINLGAVLHSKGYAIETKHPVKAGDTIPVLVVGDNIVSVDPLEGTNETDRSKPWFIASPE